MTLEFENEWPEESGGELFEGTDLKATAVQVFETSLEIAGCPYEASVNLLLTDDDAIRQMNAQFRQIDRTTDVLSFPMLPFEKAGDFSFLENEETDADYFDPESGELLLGDIVISMPRCIAQAESYGHSLRREFAFLVAHSMLHLCGYDHMDELQEKEMFGLQEKILEKLSISR